MSLTDHDGKPVGCFLSPELPAQMEQVFNEWMDQEPTAEEVRQALADPRRHSTEDILKLLEE